MIGEVCSGTVAATPVTGSVEEAVRANRALAALYRTGDIDPIFQRWLGALGVPGPLLHAMFYLSAIPAPGYWRTKCWYSTYFKVARSTPPIAL